MIPAETQRRRRGHDFYPPAGSQIPGMYAQDGLPDEDHVVYVHYFAASGDWWITELDPDTGEAFGYVKMAANPEGAEWGYVYLPELETVNVLGGLVIVERDLHWEPARFGDIREARA